MFRRADGVVARSADQRDALEGEPRCVVCQRYGEYICDETDDDVCSLECKAVVIRMWGEAASQMPAPAVQLQPMPSVSERHDRSGARCQRRFNLQNESIRVKDHCGAISRSDSEAGGLWRKMSKLQAEAVRKKVEISVTGSDVPAPIVSFSDCQFLPRLLVNLETLGFENPTAAQMQTIPAALEGRDLLVSAATGSGKTASYLLPIIQKCCMIRLKKLARHVGRPLALVLTPTRELCGQVEQQARMFGEGLPFKTALVVGGDALPKQVYRIENGVELIVGTPGRLIDLLTKHPVELEDVCVLVLDEVDCMLEQGFRDQVMQLVQALSQPQVLMFSATIPPVIERLSEKLLNHHLVVSVGNPSLPSSAVKQTVIWVETSHKKRKLFEILKSSKHFTPPAVVFVDSRIGAELLAEAVQLVTGLKAAAVHGEKPTQERRAILAQFLNGDLPIVIATGVLGRGLDLIRVTQVIVFDMPRTLEDYVHQIGRASRMSNPGSALVFVNNNDKAVFRGLIEMLRLSKSPVPRELANSPFVHSSFAVTYKTKKRKNY